MLYCNFKTAGYVPATTRPSFTADSCFHRILTSGTEGSSRKQATLYLLFFPCVPVFVFLADALLLLVDLVAFFPILLVFALLLFGCELSLLLISLGACAGAFERTDFESLLIFLGDFTAGLIDFASVFLLGTDKLLLVTEVFRTGLALISLIVFFDSAFDIPEGRERSFNSPDFAGCIVLNLLSFVMRVGSAFASLPFSTCLTGFINPPVLPIPLLLSAFSDR